MKPRLLDAFLKPVELPRSEPLVQSEQILASETYPLPVPGTVQPGCLNQQNHPAIVSNPVSLLRAENARVFFTNSQLLIRDANSNALLNVATPDSAVGAMDWQTHKHLAGTSLLLSERAGASCYYHWMLDFLPRIGMLETAGITLDDIDHVVVRRLDTAFQFETLHKLGIGEEKIVISGATSYLECENLLHVSLDNFINFYMHQRVVEWLRQRFGATTRDKPSLKLYISRPSGVRRGVTNESALQPILQSHGFETVKMEGMSVSDQAELLSQARVVIAPHGGALTNMVFCDPGTHIVELFGKLVMPFYFGLAALCKHHYHAIIEDSQDYARLIKLHEPIRFSPEQLQQGFAVNPKHLDATLDKVA